MNVFVLVKEGVYMQAIMGVYSTRALALVDGWAAKEREEDDYHTFEIYEVPMGRLPNKSDLGDFNSFDVLTVHLAPALIRALVMILPDASPSQSI